jgi:hypothetical protein
MLTREPKPKRPRKPDLDHDIVSIRAHLRLIAHLRRIAGRQGLSLAVLIRDALVEYANKAPGVSPADIEEIVTLSRPIGSKTWAEPFPADEINTGAAPSDTVEG